MTKVIRLDWFRQMKLADEEELAYQAKILSMSKLELLDEMVRFNEERQTLEFYVNSKQTEPTYGPKKASGSIPLKMMKRGHYLFKTLESVAETEQLQILARSFRRHLEIEIQQATHYNTQ